MYNFLALRNRPAVQGRLRRWAGFVWFALALGLPSVRAAALTLLWDAPAVEEEVQYYVYSRSEGDAYDYSQPICRTFNTWCRVNPQAELGVTRYYVVRSFLPPNTFSVDSNEAAYRDWVDGVGDIILPPPLAQDQFIYELASAPTIGSVPRACKPLSVELSHDGRLNISLALPPFESRIDVYVALRAPALQPDVYFLSEYGGWIDSRFGRRKWMSDKFGDVEVPLISSIDYGSLPAGGYFLYTAVAPAGRTDSYYIWVTRLDVD